MSLEFTYFESHAIINTHMVVECQKIHKLAGRFGRN